MKRWTQRLILVFAICFVAIFVGDLVVFKLRGSPLSKVKVNRYTTIPLKGNKKEFDYLGASDIPCSISLFPQAGQNPCWEVRRAASQSNQM
jgi:hypothetical protein